MVYFYIQRYINHYSLYNIVNRNILLNALYHTKYEERYYYYRTKVLELQYSVFKFVVIASKAVETTEKVGSETNLGYKYSIIHGRHFVIKEKVYTSM